MPSNLYYAASINTYLDHCSNFLNLSKIKTLIEEEKFREVAKKLDECGAWDEKDVNELSYFIRRKKETSKIDSIMKLSSLQGMLNCMNCISGRASDSFKYHLYQLLGNKDSETMQD